MSTLTPIKILLTGDSSGAEKAAKDAGGAFGFFEEHIKGIAATIGGVFAAAKVKQFATDSISSFKSLGSETLALQRVTGGSAESLSRLNFAAKETGIGTEQLSSGLVKLSKNLGNADKLTKETGISFKDAHGKLLPLDSAMGKIAEKFKSMPNGIAKNQLAIQLFGKSGAELIPILNKGKEGLGELGKQADKFGLTLTQNNLEALKKNNLAHKEFHAALEGLKVQIGANLLPVLTQLTEAFNSYLIPAITTATNWVEKNLGPVFSTAFGLAESAAKSLSDYVSTTLYPWLVDKWNDAQPAIQSLWETVQSAFSKAQDIAENILVPALTKVWDWLQNHVFPAAENVASSFNSNLLPAIGSNKSAAAIWGVAAAVGGVATSLSDIQIPEALLTPGGAFVATIAALAAGFGDWSGKVKALKDDLQPVLDSVSGKKPMVPFTGPVAGPRPMVQGKAPSISEALKKVDWQKVGEDVSTFLGTALAGAATGAEKIAQGFSALLKKIDWFNVGKSIGTTAAPLVLGVALNIFNADWVGLFSAHWEEILLGAILLALAPAKWIAKIGEALEGIPIVGTFLKWILDKSVAISEGFFQAAGRILGRLFDGIIEGLGGGANAIERVAIWLGELAARVFGFGEETFKGGGHLVQRLIDGILNLVEELGKAIGRVIAKIAEGLHLPDLWQAGVDMIQGLINGIKSMGEAVKNAVEGVAKGAADKFKNFFGIKSPSKLMHSYGTFIMQGLAKGIDDNSDLASFALNGAATGILPSTGTSSVSGGISYSPTYNLGNVYGVDDLQRLLNDHDAQLLQLIEAS